ncbi:branched-chain amino acid ABC transporter permease [Enterovirga rhinocerotis]|uniref:Amino acid/amide ABC transporter membrane protein 1 (HAAT family) n=1 Tax=Enterovirga rhinocerotis TaxID=1339210 RepID=A0A4R7C394_9HYPH|nr:branched-chain amino acid ABC transporter permease [Enterovirga rhinocerotis]TDR92894.1 amino acid/amide ABC transporter membrane protein 1 (HAAT family) [Enterovirga rhinocerotis]
MGLGTVVAQTIVNGLMVGMIYVLMAIGFTLVFGIMRIVNFAHGEFYMIGAFVFAIVFDSLGVPVAVSILAAVIVVGLSGVVVERAIFRPFTGDELNGMIASLGLALILQNGALLVLGPSPRSVPAIVDGTVSMAGLVFSLSRMTVIGVGAVAILALYLLVVHTQFGRAMRAVAQDPEIALVQGIRPERVYPIAFALGVALAALAGALMAPVLSVSPFIGLTPTLKAFIVVVIGGLGSIPGAVLGGLLLGLIESAAGTFLSAVVADIAQFVIVIAVVLLRPWGLLGKKEREA